MNHTNYQSLVDKGRKSGLNTRELYQALATRRPEDGDQLGKADCNGYISTMNQTGQRVYHQQAHPPRS